MCFYQTNEIALSLYKPQLYVSFNLITIFLPHIRPHASLTYEVLPFCFPTMNSKGQKTHTLSTVLVSRCP